MFPRLIFVLQAPEDDNLSGGGGDTAAAERTNDGTPSITDFDWDSEFKAISNRLDDDPDSDRTSSPSPSPAPAPSPAPSPDAPRNADGTPAAAPAPATSTTTPDHNTFPRSWSKDLEPVWGTLPEAAKQQIHKREQDVLRGINFYKQGHDFAQSIAPELEPYQQLIAEGAIEPRALVKNLLRGHHLLANSPEDRRVELFRTLMQQYDVPLAKLAGGQQPQQGQQGEDTVSPAVQRHIDALTTELNRVKSQTTAIANTEAQRQQQVVQQQAAQAKEAVSQLVTNTNQFPFANELLPDMYRLVASGVVTTLEEAYRQAEWMNPSTREKLIQKQAENQRLNALKARDASSVNVRKQGADGREGDPPQDLDDTLKARLKELRAAG